MSNTETDALIGLGFEIGGGLGRTTGKVIGKAGHLYLVQKDGFTHLELFEIDDLRQARFYRGRPPGVAEAAVEATVAQTAATPREPVKAASPEPAPAQEAPPKRRLTDQIRRAVTKDVS